MKAVRTTNAVERELQNDIIASFEDSGVTLPKDKRARAKEIADRITALAHGRELPGPPDEQQGVFRRMEGPT